MNEPTTIKPLPKPLPKYYYADGVLLGAVIGVILVAMFAYVPEAVDAVAGWIR